MIKGINRLWVKNDKMKKCIDDFSDIDECKGNHSCHMNAICTNTKGSYVCNCHPGYTENGRGCAGIWCVSFVTIFIRKKSTIIVVKLVLPLYLVLRRDECRPEDNIDDDTIVLNKHSGEKNLNWQRKTWWMGSQDRTMD